MTALRGPGPSLVDRVGWLVYPVGAVFFGALLGSAAGRRPRGADPLTAVSGHGSAALLEVVLVSVALVVLFAVGAGAVSFVTNGSGFWQRLKAGSDGVACALGCAGAVLALLAVCSVVAVLCLWAGLSAGPQLGAVLGAPTVVAVFGWCVRGAVLFGRPLGRYMVNKKREAVGDGEEDPRGPGRYQGQEGTRPRGL